MPLKLVVWDLDGTLIHFKINSVKAKRVAIKILREGGVPRQYLKSQKPIFEIIEGSKTILKEHGISDKKIEELIGKANNAIVLIERQAASDASTIPGIKKVLNFIFEKKLKQAIFTFNTHNNAVYSLKKAGIHHYFDLIAGRDNVRNLKPHHDHLHYLCDKLNVKPDEIIVIGDSSRDIEAALNIGAKSIGIKTPISRIFQGKNFEKASAIISLSEIPSKLIEELKKIL